MKAVGDQLWRRLDLGCLAQDPLVKAYRRGQAWTAAMQHRQAPGVLDQQELPVVSMLPVQSSASSSSQEVYSTPQIYSSPFPTILEAFRRSCTATPKGQDVVHK